MFTTKAAMKSFRAATTGLALTIAATSMGYAQNTGAVETKQYDDGGIYEGTFKDGKQHGTGNYRLPSGYEYNGEWVDGEIKGQGEIGRAHV